MQHVNGFATLSLEYDLARRHCLSLTGSKRGVGNGDRIYPLQLRWSWYSNGHSDDSPFWYVEDGVGYNRDARVRLALTGGIGAGYRYRLGNHSFVDMAARVSSVKGSQRTPTASLLGSPVRAKAVNAPWSFAWMSRCCSMGVPL